MKRNSTLLCILLLSACASPQTVVTPIYYPDLQRDLSVISAINSKSLYLTIYDNRTLPENVIGYEDSSKTSTGQPILLAPNVGRAVRDAMEDLLTSRGHTIGTLDGIIEITIKRFELETLDEGLSTKTVASIDFSILVKEPTGATISTLAFSSHAANTHVASFESTQKRLVVDALNAIMQKIDQSTEFATALKRL